MKNVHWSGDLKPFLQSYSNYTYRDMSKTRYDKHDIEDLLGLTPRQLRTRLSQLDGTISSHTYEGKRGATLLDESGFVVLKRIKELEDDGMSIQDAAETVEEEMENNNGNGTEEGVTESQVDDELVNQLKERIRNLEQDKQFLKDEVDRLHHKVDRLLPGETEEKQGFMKKFFFWVW